MLISSALIKFQLVLSMATIPNRKRSYTERFCYSSSMQIRSYLPATLDELLSPFAYELSAAQSVKCIAYSGIVSDEVYAVYEIHNSDRAKIFLGTMQLDHDHNLARDLAYMKSWSQSKDVSLIERVGDTYLFNLVEPFGIRFDT